MLKIYKNSLIYLNIKLYYDNTNNIMESIKLFINIFLVSIFYIIYKIISLYNRGYNVRYDKIYAVKLYIFLYQGYTFMLYMCKNIFNLKCIKFI